MRLSSDWRNKLKLGCKHGQVHEGIQHTILCKIYYFLPPIPHDYIFLIPHYVVHELILSLRAQFHQIKPCYEYLQSKS